MPAIIKENNQWIVRSKYGEFIFSTHGEAQKKADEDMWKEAREKGLL